MIKRGEIYYCDLGDCEGSVQSGLRPVLIIQNSRHNETSPTTIVAPITSAIKKTGFYTHVYLGEEFGLNRPSMVELEQIRTVNRKDLREYVGFIDDRYVMNQINNGLKKSLGMWTSQYSAKKDIRCLCQKCLSDYMAAGTYIVKRLDSYERIKEPCDKCGRPGYTYILIDRADLRNKENRPEGT